MNVCVQLYTGGLYGEEGYRVLAVGCWLFQCVASGEQWGAAQARNGSAARPPGRKATPCPPPIPTTYSCRPLIPILSPPLRLLLLLLP